MKLPQNQKGQSHRIAHCEGRTRSLQIPDNLQACGTIAPPFRRSKSLMLYPIELSGLGVPVNSNIMPSRSNQYNHIENIKLLYVPSNMSPAALEI